ncbi:hypothetical protein Y032_0016g2890 [Ancylostoma ceylanicum]|uniref:Uncharacterized protein n=1 Tax=Ancylostoma ceylanicum TaxID=53326 RepID=A0A016V6P2_9BILA|nr:hypothetical protein Y032_0016g2890 [Ancylostoma ceylanicum]
MSDLRIHEGIAIFAWLREILSWSSRSQRLQLQTADTAPRGRSATPPLSCCVASAYRSISSFRPRLKTESAAFGSGDLFESTSSRRNLIGEGDHHVSFDQYFRASTPELVAQEPIGYDNDAEILSKGVIESLFSGVALTPPETDSKDRPYPLWKPDHSKAARSLYMDRWNKADYSSVPHPTVRGDDNLATRSDTSETMLPLSNVPVQSTSYADTVDATNSHQEEVTDVGDGEEDSWEDLDDTKLEQQMNALKLEVAAKPAKQPINYFASPVTCSPSWDPAFLGHVLEAYDVPEYKLAEDVVNALASTDWGTASVKWLERKMVFVVFGSERQGMVIHCLT